MPLSPGIALKASAASIALSTEIFVARPDDVDDMPSKIIYLFAVAA